MKKYFLFFSFIILSNASWAWGFFAHRLINYQAVFLLPPSMLLLYKPQINFLHDHAVDPDKRRYILKEEGPRHYIDLDHYGLFPYDSLPRSYKDAETRYSKDTLAAHGIVPWWLQTMMYRLTQAFKDRDQNRILKYSAEIGHYIADAHVPLHTSSNHNGQFTDQRGIHGLWESRLPELLCTMDESSGLYQWNLFLGRAVYIPNTSSFFWQRVLESGQAADTVLKFEKQLSISFHSDKKYAYEKRNGIIVRQYSQSYSRAYDHILKGMVERRLRQSIIAVASCWFTAWVNAGQPDLSTLINKEFSPEEMAEFEKLNQAWNTNEKEHG